MPSSRRVALCSMSAPMARNWPSPPPRPVWTMNGPDDMAASVPICSANNTGCHKGTRNRQPIGRFVHSARMRPSIGTFCTYPAGPVEWWSPRVNVSRPARSAARASLSTDCGPARWPPGPSVEKTVPIDMPTRIILQVYSTSWNRRTDRIGHRAGRRRGDFHRGGQKDGWSPSEQVGHLGVDVTVNVHAGESRARPDRCRMPRNGGCRSAR